MGKSGELFMSMMASKMDPDEYFHWLTTQEEQQEQDLNQELLTGNKPSLNDLDNLFTIDEEDE